jgi:hypothetical protein
MPRCCAGSLCLNADSETDAIVGGKCPYCDGIRHVECGTASGGQLGVTQLYQQIICFKCERQRLAIPRPPTLEAGQDVLASAVEDDDNMAEDEVVVGGEVDATLPLVPPGYWRRHQQDPPDNEDIYVPQHAQVGDLPFLLKKSKER